MIWWAIELSSYCPLLLSIPPKCNKHNTLILQKLSSLLFIFFLCSPIEIRLIVLNLFITLFHIFSASIFNERSENVTFFRKRSTGRCEGVRKKSNYGDEYKRVNYGKLFRSCDLSMESLVWQSSFIWMILIVREIPKEYEALKFHQVTKRKVSLTRLCSVQRKYVFNISSSFQNWSVCSNLLPWHWSIHWYTILWSKPNTLEVFFRTMGTKKPRPCFGKKSLSFTSHL